MAMICRNVLVIISLVVAACDQSNDSLVRDLAECETVAKQAGDWERDGWDAGTATGEYLIDCMKSKGYRRRTMTHDEVYNSWNDVRDKTKPLYRSKEAELFVLRGCNLFKIAIAECWEK
jgi:hypothetical protein